MLTFDGVDDRAMTESIAGIPVTYPFTLAGVIQFDGGAGQRTIMAMGSAGGNNPWRLSLNVTGAIQSNVGTAAANSSIIVPTGTPYFVAVAHLDATTHRCFGYNYSTLQEFGELLIGSQTPGATASPRLKIGCRSAGESDASFSNFWLGSITWLAVWDRYLGSAGDGYDSLRALAQQGPLVHGMPAFFADFCEGSGTTANDRSVNANHATLYNGVQWQTWQVGQGPTPCTVYSAGDVIDAKAESRLAPREAVSRFSQRAALSRLVKREAIKQ